MYECKVYHAIQHTNVQEFHMRYRTYSTKAERDRTFDMLQAEQDEPNPLVRKVTLTVTAETVPEQTTMFGEANG